MRLINIIGLPFIIPILITGFLACLFEGLMNFLSNIIAPVTIIVSFLLPISIIVYALFRVFGG